MTLREAVLFLQRQLGSVSDLAPTASQDAAGLVLGMLGLPRTALYSNPTRGLSQMEQECIAEVLRRRLAGEPMQYILGTQEFFGLLLAVTPAVLIPRPETEHLIEAGMHGLPADRPVLLADVGTGSGAIAIAMAVHLPLARVFALDLSPAALAVARENAARHRVAERISFLESDLLSALPSEAVPLDAIFANPPYIPLEERPRLHRQVREFEPHVALFAPPEPSARDGDEVAASGSARADDGLALYRRLLPQALAALRPGGLVGLEFGAGQQSGLEELLREWAEVQFLPDLQGIPRVALARRPANYSRDQSSVAERERRPARATADSLRDDNTKEQQIPFGKDNRRAKRPIEHSHVSLSRVTPWCRTAPASRRA